MKYIITLFIVLFSMACTQVEMKTGKDVIVKIEEFRKKEKFVGGDFLYTGIEDEALKAITTEKINQVSQDFEEVAKNENPTEDLYLKKIELGLERFSGIYLEFDTEDRERVCRYFEELMDIVGLESSNGQLNKFMYGFNLEE